MVAKKAAKKTPKQFYVGVTNPNGVQRQILTATADYLKLLRAIEHLSQLRKEKHSLLETFRSQMAQIRTDVNSIYARLPKQGIQHKVEAVEKKESKPKPKPKAKPQSELQKLEADLAMIEKKLQGL